MKRKNYTPTHSMSIALTPKPEKDTRKLQTNIP